jgi:hypothetical protein
MTTEYLSGTVIKIAYNAVADTVNFVNTAHGMAFVLAALLISGVFARGRIILNTLAAIMIAVAATAPNHQSTDVLEKCILLFLGLVFFIVAWRRKGITKTNDELQNTKVANDSGSTQNESKNET